MTPVIGFIECDVCTFLGRDETPLFPTAVAVERGDRRLLSLQRLLWERHDFSLRN
jgi:hypothetical protein